MDLKRLDDFAEGKEASLRELEFLWSKAWIETAYNGLEQQAKVLMDETKLSKEQARGSSIYKSQKKGFLFYIKVIYGLKYSAVKDNRHKYKFWLNELEKNFTVLNEKLDNYFISSEPKKDKKTEELIVDTLQNICQQPHFTPGSQAPPYGVLIPPKSGQITVHKRKRKRS